MGLFNALVMGVVFGVIFSSWIVGILGAVACQAVAVPIMLLLFRRAARTGQDELRNT